MIKSSVRSNLRWAFFYLIITLDPIRAFHSRDLRSRLMVAHVRGRGRRVSTQRA